MYETVHSFPWSHEGCFSSAIFYDLEVDARILSCFFYLVCGTHDCNARMLLPMFNLSWPTFDALQLSVWSFWQWNALWNLGKNQQKLSFRVCWVYLLVCLLTLFDTQWQCYCSALGCHQGYDPRSRVHRLCQVRLYKERCCRALHHALPLTWS